MEEEKEAGPSGETGEGAEEKIRELLQALSMRAPGPVNQRKEKKPHYAFWSSQPVTQFEDSRTEVGVPEWLQCLVGQGL